MIMYNKDEKTGELYHSGIKGQRWGIRRFQNEDGSLTPEGELRYNQGKQKLARGKAAEMYKTKKYKAKLALKQEKQKVKDAAELAKTAKKEQAKLNAEDRVIKKKAKNMTDEELRNEVNRLAMELDYQKKSWQLEKSKKGPTMLDKADSFFETTTGRLVGQLGSSIIQNVAQTQLNNIISEKTNTLKKQQILNAKKVGEKTQAEIDLKKAEYKKTYGDTESSNKNTDTNTKSAGDFVKEALNKNSGDPVGVKDNSPKSTHNTINAKEKYKDFSDKVYTKVNLGNVKANKPKNTTYSMKNEETYKIKNSKFSDISKYSVKSVGSMSTTPITEYDLFGQEMGIKKTDPISIVLNDEDIKKIKW